MRKYTYLLLVLFMVSIATTSCNQYRSISSATKVSQLGGNPFYFNLSKSILKNLGTFLTDKGLKKSVGKINLMTPISSILTNNDQVSEFKKLLTTAYQVYPKKIESSFGKIGNVRDLIMFVAYNGRNFNFSK